VGLGEPTRRPLSLLLLVFGASLANGAQSAACWIRDVASYGDETTWVLCDNGRIYRTDDGGGTWTTLHLGEVRARAIRLSSVHHAVVACADGLLLVTEDGGASWRPRVSGVRSHLNSIAIRGNSVWVAGNDGTILNSADGGQTWRVQPSLTRNNLEGIWFLDEQHGWAVGWNGIILRTADGGSSWEPVSAANVYQTLTAAPPTAGRLGNPCLPPTFTRRSPQRGSAARLRGGW